MSSSNAVIWLFMVSTQAEPTSLIQSAAPGIGESHRYTHGTTQHPPLPRHGGERAAFAIARVLEVDPVMRIDAIERDAVSRPQDLDQDPPRLNLRLGRPARDVGIIAGEFHADRGILVHLVIGLAVVDVFVVVA